VPGHRRLAISRLRVPNLDGVVLTPAGNLFCIGAPRHRVDPEIVRSQDTNQQEQREKNGKKLTRPSARSASIIVNTQNECFWLFYISIFRGHTHLKKVNLFEWFFTPDTLRQEHDWSCYFSSILIKHNLRARVAGQRRLAFNILKSFTFISFSSCIYQQYFSFRVVCLSHGHSKRKNDFWVIFLLHLQKKKRTGLSARPTTGQSPKFKLKSFTFMSFSSMYSSTASYLFEWVISRQLKTGIWFFCYFSQA